MGVAEATNRRLRTFTLNFRASLAKTGGLTQFDGALKRRSLLAQGMEQPLKLMKASSKGRGRSIEVSDITLVLGGQAWHLECSLDGPAAWFQPQPTRNEFHVSVYSMGERLTYTVGFGALVSVTMEIKPESRVGDVNGVFAITMFFVVAGEVQVVSIVPLKSDQSACVMLANLAALKDPLLRAASTGSGTLPIEVQVPLAWSSAVLSSEASGAPVDSPSGINSLSCAWARTTLTDALVRMPGVHRLISYHEGKPLGDLGDLTAGCGSKDTALSFALARPKASAKRIRKTKKGTAQGKKKKRKEAEREDVRQVNAWMEEEDDRFINENSDKALSWLEEKWLGLSVHDHGDKDYDPLSGEVTSFLWRGDVEPPQWVSQIQDEEGAVTDYSVLELPEMVKEAQHPDDVLVHFDQPEDTCIGYVLEQVREGSGACSDDDRCRIDCCYKLKIPVN